MPNNKTIKTILAAVLAIVMAAPAAASGVDTNNPAFAAVTGPTSIPIGHAEFCKSHRDDCAANSRVVEMIELNEARWEQLLVINADLNSEIVPITDADLYNVSEYWTYPRGYGDCEDIALAKRQALIADGWAPSTLLIAVVRQSNGEGHAVLMVRTDRGDLVLDNQDGMIKVWTDTPYQYIKRQSQSDQGKWVGIDDNRATIVAATR